MKFSFFIKKIFLLIITLSFCPLVLFSENKEFKNPEYNFGVIDAIDLEELVENSEYILGPGDKLFLRFFGVSEFSGEVEILNDGTISIPIVGDIYVSGMTKELAEQKIENLLTSHLIQKDIQILIIKPRKIKIAVLGEVNNPGIYSMTEEEVSLSAITEDPLNPILIKGVPTLVDAIQKSGGLTKNAELSNVLLKRRIQSDDSKSYMFAYTNLLKLISEGDFSQNPFLFDGDVIKIGVNNGYANSTKLFGNLSPNKIDIFVIGEVNNPGLVRVKSNSPISKAILAAGGPKGLRTNKSNIKIIRSNNLGEYSVKEYKFNLKNDLKNKEYPLSDGDVILVGKSNLSQSGDAINLVTKPFFGLVQVLQFIRLLENNND